MKIKDTSGGMLLYAIIVSMVISFTCAALTAVSLNQSIITEREIARKQAANLVRAGFEYAYDQLGRGIVNGPGTINLPGYNNVSITISNRQSGDPAGINYRIVVNTEY